MNENVSSQQTSTDPDTDEGNSLVARDPVDSRNPAMVYLARLAPGSRRTMADALETIANIATSGQHDARNMPWQLLRYQHTAAIRVSVIERYAPSTANKIMSALRGVLRESWNLEMISAEDYHRAAGIKSVKFKRLPTGRSLASGERAALFEVCQSDASPAGARDGAVLAILYGAGLRRSELVALDLADYNLESGALSVRAAKGRKDRTTYAANGAALAIGAWLKLRGEEPGPLLCRVYRQTIKAARLSDQAVLQIVRRRAVQAGVARFSPHDLRRSFVSDLLDAGADINSVRDLAGHSSVDTTARYDRRGEAAKKRAGAMLHVPWRA